MIQRVNLLPEELRTVNKRYFYFVASISIVLLFSTLFSINNIQKVKIRDLAAKRDSLRESVAALAQQDVLYREVSNKINTTEAKKKGIEARAGVVKRISDGTTRWSDPLYELSNIVPDGLWFSSLLSSDIAAGDKKVKGIRVSGISLSNSRITDFMAAVEASPLFEDVSLAYVQNIEFKGREAFSFEITFRIGGKG